MRKIKGVFAFFLLASQLCGQNYYVAPPPAGNDGNSGLSGAPWATLQYAVNRLAAGDVLTVEDGTYTGFYMDRIKGTAAQRITITARNRLGAVINAPPAGRTRNCEFLSCSYITFDGFEVTLAPAGGIVFRTYEYEYTGVNCRDNIVQYCHSHHNSVGDPTGSHDGIFTGFALNFTAQYNTVHDNGEHGIYDVVNKTAIPRISSVHHQAVIANPEIGMEVIAVCNKSTARWLNDMDCDVGKRQDVEAFFFRDACFLGIQGHPEYRGYNQFAKWTLDLIQSYIVCNPDLHWQNSQYRIKSDLVAQRNAGWAKRKKSITKPLTITQTKKGTN